MSWFYLDFCLLTFNPFLKITCGTNDRLKLTFKKKWSPIIGEIDEDAQNNKENP